MTTLQLVQIHSTEQVRDILLTAHTIAADLVDEGVSYREGFDKAVDLLSARIPIAPQAPLFAPREMFGTLK